MKMSPVLHLPSDIHLCRASSKASRLPTFLKLLQNRHVLLTFDKVRNPFALATPNDVWKSKSALYPSVFYTFDMNMLLRATTACTFSTSQLPKVVRLWCVLYILTWTCVSRRHNGVHFFDITALKKCTELGVFCTFWLGNVLRATTACTFSTSQLPKVVRTLVCFGHFDLEMCFAPPQRRALFRHRNFQKVVRSLVCFVHFDFEVCFAPQWRALFRHLNFQNWSECWCVLYILETCFALQRRAIFHLSSGQMAPHPSL